MSIENSKPRLRVEPACFGTPVRLEAVEPSLQIRLGARHSEALAELVPLLLCGEESAVLSFARYGSSVVLGASGRHDFQLLQADEVLHARYLQSLRGSLPVPRSDARQRARLRRFWKFASADHRDAFVADPMHYAPQYGGYCAFAVSQGTTAHGDPNQWAVVDQRLFVNNNVLAKKLWEADLSRNVRVGDVNWPLIPKLDETPDHASNPTPPAPKSDLGATKQEM